MGLGEAIDITFDFRADTPPGKDPDDRSPTLRRYHQILWSKPFPSGAPFELDVTTPGTYLHHLSELGEFSLSSDAVIPSLSRAPELKHSVHPRKRNSSPAKGPGGVKEFKAHSR